MTTNGKASDDDIRREFIANIAFTRAKLFSQLMGDARRDLNQECGYADDLTDVKLFHDLYDREPIAARVVEVLAKECWQVSPLVYELEDSDEATAFEKAWDELGKSLRGEKSHYKDEEGSPVWEYLQRADILSGIGAYGVILLGLDDGLSLEMPVKGVEESASVAMDTKGNGDPWDGDLYKFSTNAEATKGRKLKYLRVFPETLAEIVRFEANPSSPRFGQPITYNVTFNDYREVRSGIGAPTATRQVHWTRIIHVADNLGSSEVFGIPRMRQVYNRLMDLRKIHGAAGEAYWRGGFPGFTLESDPRLGGDVEFDIDKMRDMIENYDHGMQKSMILNGFMMKQQSPNCTDPTPYLASAIEAICIKLGCPVRIFKGSERGELASSQDDAAWNDRVKARQTGYLTPRLIVPFVDRLIAIGVLPEPKASPKEEPEEIEDDEISKEPVDEVEYVKEVMNAIADLEEAVEEEEPFPPKAKDKPKKPPHEKGYCIEWPDITSQTAKEKADVANVLTTAISAYVAGGCDTLLAPIDFLTRVVGMDEEEAQSIIENAEQRMEEEMENQPVLPPIPGQPDPNNPFAPKDPFAPGPGPKNPFEKKPNPFAPQEPIENVYCPTGPGGGIDPSCSPGSEFQGYRKDAGKPTPQQQIDKLAVGDDLFALPKSDDIGETLRGPQKPKSTRTRKPEAKIKAAQSKVDKVNAKIATAKSKLNELKAQLKSSKANLSQVKKDAKKSLSRKRKS
jgi:hypothetical protein